MAVPLTLTLAFVLAALLWNFGHLSITRYLMAASIILGCITLPSELYVNEYFTSAGCEGRWLTGLSCPNWSIWITLATWHDVSGLLFILYLIGVFPFVWVALLVAEVVASLHRRKA